MKWRRAKRRQSLTRRPGGSVQARNSDKASFFESKEMKIGVFFDRQKTDSPPPMRYSQNDPTSGVLQSERDTVMRRRDIGLRRNVPVWRGIHLRTKQKMFFGTESASNDSDSLIRAVWHVLLERLTLPVWYLVKSLKRIVLRYEEADLDFFVFCHYCFFALRQSDFSFYSLFLFRPFLPQCIIRFAIIRAYIYFIVRISNFLTTMTFGHSQCNQHRRY